MREDKKQREPNESGKTHDRQLESGTIRIIIEAAEIREVQNGCPAVIWHTLSL